MNKIYPFQPVESARNNKYYLKVWLHFKRIMSTESRNPRLVKRNPSLVLHVNKKKIILNERCKRK